MTLLYDIYQIVSCLPEMMEVLAAVKKNHLLVADFELPEHKLRRYFSSVHRALSAGADL
jgi:hypothetical protein